MGDRSQSQGKGPSSSASTRRANQGSSTSASQGLSDRPTFTFIDHDDDLSSKRIKDAKARKAIRSHVMRDVRRRERLAGLKRVSKREDRSNSDQYTSSDVSQKESHTKASYRERSLPLRTSPSPQFGSRSSACSQTVISPRNRRRNTTWSPKEMGITLTSQIPGSHSTIDPFYTLPGASKYPTITQTLVRYLFTVFIPMTFPTEDKAARDNDEKMKVMVKSSFTDTGSFYGAMSMMAAHRAALTGRHSDLANVYENSVVDLYDPDYYIMKANAMREMNAKLQDPRQALSDEAFGTIINLLTGAMIVGLFTEAHVHLKGLSRMVSLRNGTADLDAHMTATIVASDLKASAGLMTKPVLRLWPIQPVPRELKARIHPSLTSPLNLLGLGFEENPFLGEALLTTLDRFRDNLLLMDLGNQSPEGLTPDDSRTMFRLSSEVEHQLLSYPFRTPGGLDLLHPVEAVVRVAAEFSLNQIIIYSPPSTGLARALTRHLKRAVENCIFGGLSPLPANSHDLLAWALFTGAQGSINQVEYPWFVSRLADIILSRGWTSWEQIQSVIKRYIYVSYLQESYWRTIWEEAFAHAATTEVEAEDAI